jgi:hypothetical protein
MSNDHTASSPAFAPVGLAPDAPMSAPGWARGSIPGAARLQRRTLVIGLGALAAGCGGGGADAPVLPPAAPTLEISSNVPDVAEGRVTVRFEFSSEPKAFPATGLPFAMTGGKAVAGSFTKVSATLYTVQIDPNANTLGVIQITVPTGAFSELTAQAFNTTAYSFAQRYDTRVPVTEPTAEITTNVVGQAAGAFEVRFTFNLDVGDSFVASDVIVTNATSGAFAKLSSTVYTLQVVPPSATTGLCIIEVPPGAVTAVSSGASNARSLSIAVFYKT